MENRREKNRTIKIRMSGEETREKDKPPTLLKKYSQKQSRKHSLKGAMKTQ
jgi:hypothetical protein